MLAISLYQCSKILPKGQVSKVFLSHRMYRVVLQRMQKQPVGSSFETRPAALKQCPEHEQYTGTYLSVSSVAAGVECRSHVANEYECRVSPAFSPELEARWWEAVQPAAAAADVQDKQACFK